MVTRIRIILESTDRSEEDDDDELESSQGFQVLFDAFKPILAPPPQGAEFSEIASISIFSSFHLAFLMP